MVGIAALQSRLSGRLSCPVDCSDGSQALRVVTAAVFVLRSEELEGSLLRSGKYLLGLMHIRLHLL